MIFAKQTHTSFVHSFLSYLSLVHLPCTLVRYFFHYILCLPLSLSLFFCSIPMSFTILVCILSFYTHVFHYLCLYSFVLYPCLSLSLSLFFCSIPMSCTHVFHYLCLSPSVHHSQQYSYRSSFQYIPILFFLKRRWCAWDSNLGLQDGRH